MEQKTILVTGGAGFIGSNFVRLALQQGQKVVVVDKLTYSGSTANLSDVLGSENLVFFERDINDSDNIEEVMSTYHPNSLVNFAAESHVDRSIASADAFITTNIVGTISLLNVARSFFESLEDDKKKSFRFLQVSTDEVYGALLDGQPGFTENSQIQPNNPYSASKAAADHFVRAFNRTHGLPTLVTHCSNNYGPYQHPEKFIPTVILKAITGEEIPIYGNGRNRRDWLHVDDHCDAILAVIDRGEIGERYNIGGGFEITNIALAELICSMLDEIRPKSSPYGEQLCFVTDRKGHDYRYAIDHQRLTSKLKWKPKRYFEKAIKDVVKWYCQNEKWLESTR